MLGLLDFKYGDSVTKRRHLRKMELGTFERGRAERHGSELVGVWIIGYFLESV